MKPDYEKDNEYSALNFIRVHVGEVILAHKKARESGVTAYSATVMIDQLTEILELLDRAQARIDSRATINTK